MSIAQLPPTPVPGSPHPVAGPGPGGPGADLALAAANPGPLPPLQGGFLAERKQQLSEAIAINTSRISSSLRDQRAETLRTSLPGTLRVLVGAAIVSAFLFMLRRQI